MSSPLDTLLASLCKDYEEFKKSLAQFDTVQEVLTLVKYASGQQFDSFFGQIIEKVQGYVSQESKFQLSCTLNQIPNDLVFYQTNQPFAVFFGLYRLRSFIYL